MTSVGLGVVPSRPDFPARVYPMSALRCALMGDAEDPHANDRAGWAPRENMQNT
jgi:hypothetical protein